MHSSFAKGGSNCVVCISSSVTLRLVLKYNASSGKLNNSEGEWEGEREGERDPSVRFS